MNVLLSIKPKYAEGILGRKKRYEFRKSIFKAKEQIGTVYIYSTSPVKKIVGSFTIGAITEEHPKVLWQRFKEHAGIEEKDFFRYFGDAKKGFAIEIGSLDVFKEPADPKTLIPYFVPPQSFCYLEAGIPPGGRFIGSAHAAPQSGAGRGWLDTAGATISRLLNNLPIPRLSRPKANL